MMSRASYRRALLIAASAAAFTSCASSKTEPDTPVDGESSGTEPAPVGEVVILGAPEGLTGDVEQVALEFVEKFESADGRRAYVDDAAYEIEIFLLEQGFADAEVTYDLEEERRATIRIDAGARSLLGTVRVSADEGCPLDEEQLQGYVNGPRTGLFGSGPMLYVRARVERAPDVLARDLVGLGHLDAAATLDDPGPTREGGPVSVGLSVVTGPQYFVGEVDFALVSDAATPTADVSRAVAERLDEVLHADGTESLAYEPRLAGRLRSALQDAYGQRGHPDAVVRVESEIDRSAHLVHLTVRASPGPRVVVTSIRFETEGKTRESFLRSKLGLEPGQPFDASALRDGVRELYRTGLFVEVRPSLEGSGEDRELVLEIDERPSTEYFFEPGYGSYELFRATVGARNRNLFRAGINGSAEVTVAVRALRAVFGLSDPQFLGSNLIGDLQLNFERREEPSFVRENIDLGGYLTREWNRRTWSTAGYRFGRSDARDVEAVDDSVEEVQSKVNIASLFLSQRFDARNAIFAPTSGFLTEASAEIAFGAIGSELEFVRLRLSQFWFQPLAEGDILALAFRTGVIVPAFGENAIPIQERFFAGGENSVRSFQESELGPLDASGNPIGGEATMTASIEWRRELHGAFQSALFADAGFVEEDVADYFGFDDVRYGVGVGLRYLLPIGPLRVDFAVNPDPEEFEDDWVLHFAIGMPF